MKYRILIEPRKRVIGAPVYCSYLKEDFEIKKALKMALHVARKYYKNVGFYININMMKRKNGYYASMSYINGEYYYHSRHTAFKLKGFKTIVIRFPEEELL